VHEVLRPGKKKPLQPAYSSEFAGMARDELALETLETLEDVRDTLIRELPTRLGDKRRRFL
jgi:hypothetical protein